MSFQDSTQTVLKPKATFSVDGPTDLQNMHANWIANLTNPRSNQYEAKYGLAELEKYLGGGPDKLYKKYVYYSIYSKSEADGGSAKFIKNVPVRIYNDNDVNWWMTNRGLDLYDMNALNQSSMINFLNREGNNKAEFINAFGKGYRIEGLWHPHSWSLVEPIDCVNWILKSIR